MFRKCFAAQFLVLTVLVSVGLVPRGNSYAVSSKEDYELQERCGKRAEEFFKKKYGNGVTKIKGGQQETEYINHYNKNLNKCFIKLTTSNVLYKQQRPEVVTSFEILVLDINTNIEYARFINIYQKERPALCKVEERTCRDLEEWEKLTKIYMEN